LGWKFASKSKTHQDLRVVRFRQHLQKLLYFDCFLKKRTGEGCLESTEVLGWVHQTGDEALAIEDLEARRKSKDPLPHDTTSYRSWASYLMDMIM